MRNHSGFTLLETLAVVSVVGILVAVSIPMATSFNQSTGVRAAAKQLAEDLWFARQKAIATSVPYSLEFDADESTYLLFKDDGNGDPANRANGRCDSGEEVVRTRGLGPKFALSDVDLDPDDCVIFVPKGMLKNGTSGGHVTIATDDDDERTRTVVVMASGFCKVD
jgi:prepilin-type N-terminal cleavage/methylation domain-containing protein